MRRGRHKAGDDYLSWADVAKRLLNPGAFPDTPLLSAGEATVKLSEAAA